MSTRLSLPTWRTARRCGVLTLLAAVAFVVACASSAPRQAAASGLPPRPAPVPVPVQAVPSGPVDAHIELHASPEHAGAYSVVQWQDATGAWHDVDGWRQQLDSSGRVRWSVYPRNFGSGPFRWALRAAADLPDAQVSEPFNLPCCSGAGLLYEPLASPAGG